MAKSILFLLVCVLFIYPLKAENHNTAALAKYDTLVIYQFGKVGSTSLCYLFKPFCQTIHTHSPDPLIQAIKEKKKFLVVNAVRNNFDRNISGFFQHLPLLQSRLPENYQLSDLLEFFPEYNLKLLRDAEEWYQDFNQLLGINVFESPFDFKRKYSFERKETFDVLILRFEDILEWPEIIGKVLNLKNLQIPKLNVREVEFYQEFKNAFCYSEEEADLMLSVDYMQHFYSDAERTRLREKHTQF